MPVIVMKIAVLLLALAGVGLAAPHRRHGAHQTGGRKTVSAPDMTIPELVEKFGMTMLLDLAKKAGLADELSAKGPFTLFAPLNEAFQHLPHNILQNMTVVKEVLMYHVIKGAVYSGQLRNDLISPSALPNENIRINLYHHEEETVATAEGSRIILADRNASNGVIHIINRVMMPPRDGNIVALLSAQTGRGQQHEETFSTLLTAVKAAGLTETLSGVGPFTVFAPNNAAFSKLPNKTSDDLLKNTTRLKRVLLHHVVAGCQWDAGLYNGEMVKTLGGSPLTLRVEGGPFQQQRQIEVSYGMRQQARVVRPDMGATNGVVHSIDQVMLPHDHEM